MSVTTVRPEASQVTGAGRQRQRQRVTRETRQNVLLGITLSVAGLLVLRLRNTAFTDEALYVNAGHEYLAHWFGDAPLDAPGRFFTGVPVLYPVFAAILDAIGGLTLLRASSAVFIALAALSLRATAAYLWGPRAGLLTVASFVFTGPVIFLAALGTSDAAAIALLTGSLWLGLTRSDDRSAVMLGCMLALMGALKYPSILLAPVVLVAVALVARHGGRRAGLATSTTASLLGLAGLVWGDAVIRTGFLGAGNVTAASAGSLLGDAGRYVGFTIVVAAAGAVLVVSRGSIRRDWRMMSLAVLLLAGAMTLPAAQVVRDAVSFERYLSYSAVFLSLLAGLALARFSRLPLMVAPAVMAVIIMFQFGMVRSEALYSWPNVASVMNALEQDPRPGLYASSSADALAYHARDHPEMTWETTFQLYFEGDDAIRAAVSSGRYQGVILRSGPTGEPAQDAARDAFVAALEASPAYDLAFEPWPSAAGSSDLWLVYTHR